MDKDMDQAKGKIKQAIGNVTGDDDLKRDGEVDEKAGKAKEGLENVKEKIGDVIDNVKDKMKKND
ncbi:MAG: CsbD family protein [Acidimicrobiales bacterium]